MSLDSHEYCTHINASNSSHWTFVQELQVDFIVHSVPIICYWIWWFFDTVQLVILCIAIGLQWGRSTLVDVRWQRQSPVSFAINCSFEPFHYKHQHWPIWSSDEHLVSLALSFHSWSSACVRLLADKIVWMWSGMVK